MFILDLVSTCSDAAMANILTIIKRSLDLIQLIGPIVALIGLSIVLVKYITNPENKKLKGAFKNWLISLLMLFFIPVIVNATMLLLDESFSLAKCWNSVSTVSSNGESSTYVSDGDDGKRKPVLISPDSYDKGDAKHESKKSSSSSNSSISKKIFIGDSRTVMMQSAVGSSDTWSCKSSMGLNWMKSTGVPNVESQIGSGSAVIILMGVNDLYQANAYVSYINDKANSWTSKGAKVYFVSVNPISSNGSQSSLNDDIMTFNGTLKSGLNSNVKYIDTYSYLNSNGFSSGSDSTGVHYDNATSKKIYNYIVSQL